jgi:hypothetical protein
MRATLTVVSGLVLANHLGAQRLAEMAAKEKKRHCRPR